MPKKTTVTRRRAVQSMVGAGVAIVAKQAAAAAPAAPATTQSASLSLDDLAAADRVAGRTFINDDERQLMAPGMASRRRAYALMADLHIPETIPPAIHFDPRLPSTPLPTGQSGCSPSDGDAKNYTGNPDSLAFHRHRSLPPPPRPPDHQHRTDQNVPRSPQTHRPQAQLPHHPHRRSRPRARHTAGTKTRRPPAYAASRHARPPAPAPANADDARPSGISSSSGRK